MGINTGKILPTSPKKNIASIAPRLPTKSTILIADIAPKNAPNSVAPITRPETNELPGVSFEVVIVWLPFVVFV
jgi:hypothetical protein